MEKPKNNIKREKRLTFKQICKTLKITPRERIMLVRYYKIRVKKGGVDRSE